MLSLLGQKFDPLGFGSPFFIKARLILQQLAVDKYDWDTTVPDDVVKEWDAWLHSLRLLQNFSLSRWLFINSGVPWLNDDTTGEIKVVYILRDLSCIAPVGDLTSDSGLAG